MKKLILILIPMLVMLGPQEGRSQNPRCEFDVITGPDLKGALGGIGLSGACTEAVYFDACGLARERVQELCDRECKKNNKLGTEHDKCSGRSSASRGSHLARLHIAWKTKLAGGWFSVE